MTYDHEAARLHRADLDREIDMIRTERALAAHRAERSGRAGPGRRVRRAIGRRLIAAGTLLVGSEAPLRTHRA